jgi:hypothetical protein
MHTHDGLESAVIALTYTLFKSLGAVNCSHLTINHHVHCRL